MISKLEHPFLQITVCYGIFQKYKYTVEKTVDNRKKTTDYKITHIDGVEDEKSFQIISEIIYNDLKTN